METIYWHKQTTDKPLFPDLLWSRPEHKTQAGKLFIVGGNAHGFAAVAEAYAEAEKAGIGTLRVLLPSAVQKLIGNFLENTYFAASTPSGSFSQQALGELMEHADWADGVLLAGDFGRNSETAIVLEQFMKKYSGPLIITKDGVDYFKAVPRILLGQSNITLVVTLAQLQQLAKNIGFTQAFTFSMPLVQLVEMLHEFTLKFPAHIVMKHGLQMIVAVNGDVSTLGLKEDLETWRVKTAAYASVWTLQNPNQSFEALSIGIWATLQDPSSISSP